ncbi:hypothetical protein KP005_05880 [Geomonas nitrogeniifigens]|uniref:Uncharacterized protein n=1 Tax=Geomonas diazotrophica TaxID=2843197 RepID=A0ABX8JK97_9BACT|nr:hypothetical protein [Geomonas nitrogeniifigens]QWV98813.1 hypothetical protein KP005_05880 [Geomonas nitrogeniifigens]
MNIFVMVIRITLIGVLIGCFAFVVGLGKSVEAGGNISNLFSVFSKKREDELKTDKADDSDRKPPNQILRTIGGVMFGVLMLLIPILYGESRNGTPYISIDHQLRTYLVASLVACEVIIFIAMWVSERKAK